MVPAVPEYYIEVAPGRFLESNRMYFIRTNDTTKATWIQINKEGHCWFWTTKIAGHTCIDACVEITMEQAVSLIDRFIEIPNCY